MPPPCTGPQEFWQSWSVWHVVQAPPASPPPEPLLLPDPELDPLPLLDPELVPLLDPELVPLLDPELVPLLLPDALPELLPEPLSAPFVAPSSPPSAYCPKFWLESPEPHAATRATASPTAVSDASFMKALPVRAAAPTAALG